MGKYLDFAYREDTYGERKRDRIEVRITDLGYETNGLGNTVPNIEVSVGPMSWEPLKFECPSCYVDVGVPCVGLEPPYKFHSNRIRPVKVGIMRSFMYYPPNPDRLKVEQEAHGIDPSSDFLLSPDEQLSGAVLTFRSGMDPLGPVPAGSVLYITVYVSEQFNDDDFGLIWLPWDLRGRAYAVIPNNYGGTQAAIDAMPRGVMTGGMLYGEHIMNPQTLFMKTMGYVLDTVITDGELMVGPVVNMHPNMIFPLLRGFGMEAAEESLLSDRTVAHRSKHILASYNEISLMKGTREGLVKYVEAVTGMPSQIVGPVNLILDRADTCPDDPTLFVDTAGNVDLVKGVGGTSWATGVGPGGNTDTSAHTTQVSDASTNFPGYELGTRITCAVAGFITALRYYRTGTSQTSRTLRLWDVTSGTQLASVSTTGETGTGWMTVPLATPRAVSAGQQVVSSFNYTAAGPAVTVGGFPFTNMALTATTGVRVSGAGTYPNTTTTTDYMTDIVFNAGANLQWEAIPSIGKVDGYTGAVTLARPPVSQFRENETTPDPWYDPKSPEPATRWVHRFTYAGTMAYGPPLDFSYCPVVTPGDVYSFRCRFYPESASIMVRATLTFLDRNGVQIAAGGQVVLPSTVTGSVNTWNDYSPSGSATAPPGAKFLHWKIELGSASGFPAAGTGSAVSARLGALQLSTGAKPRLYRDPRAMALILDTGPGTASVGVEMNDATPTSTMNATVVTMDDGKTLGQSSVDSFERVLIAKMKSVLPRYLPAGVGIEVITSDDVEFAPYTNSDSL